jgi:hypothetical protein
MEETEHHVVLKSCVNMRLRSVVPAARDAAGRFPDSARSIPRPVAPKSCGLSLLLSLEPRETLTQYLLDIPDFTLKAASGAFAVIKSDIG